MAWRGLRTVSSLEWVACARSMPIKLSVPSRWVNWAGVIVAGGGLRVHPTVLQEHPPPLSPSAHSVLVPMLFVVN